MFSNPRVRLMTKLSIYEQEEGKEDIKLSKYYRGDYVRIKVLQTVVAVTLGFVLLIGMLAAYEADFLVREAVNLDYKSLLKFIVGVYIVVLVIYIAASLVGYSLQYNTSRKKLVRYFRMLRKLRSLYREEVIETELDQRAKLKSDLESMMTEDKEQLSNNDNSKAGTKDGQI